MYLEVSIATHRLDDIVLIVDNEPVHFTHFPPCRIELHLINLYRIFKRAAWVILPAFISMPIVPVFLLKESNPRLHGTFAFIK
jgi:hypothetical protein